MIKRPLDPSRAAWQKPDRVVAALGLRYFTARGASITSFRTNIFSSWAGRHRRARRADRFPLECSRAKV